MTLFEPCPPSLSVFGFYQSIFAYFYFSHLPRWLVVCLTKSKELSNRVQYIFWQTINKIKMKERNIFCTNYKLVVTQTAGPSNDEIDRAM